MYTTTDILHSSCHCLFALLLFLFNLLTLTHQSIPLTCTHTHTLSPLPHQATIMNKTVSTSSMTITQPMWNSSSMVSGRSRVSSVSPSCLTSHSDTNVTPIPIHALLSKHIASLDDLQISVYAVYQCTCSCTVHIHMYNVCIFAHI